MSNKALIWSVAGVLAIFVVIVLAVRFSNQNKEDKLTNLSNQSNTEQQNANTQSVEPADIPTATSTQPAGETVNGCARNYDEQKYKDANLSVNNRQVEIDVKDYGKIVVALDGQAAPKTVENFLKLVNAGFYNCLTFHRIAQDFVIQGGDPSGDGSGGPGWTVPAEIKLPHKKGSIAMARLGDQVNPNRDSSGSQFYIALNDLPTLDGQYTVFGQVVSGMDVVEKIGQLQTNPPGDGAPVTPVVIQSAEIVK
ncbi:MAG: peptidylprolyl isomerase [Patescibacteria group bacterium]|nr:peptidylprolyl isomerase [Patescibacteria group bacterium]